MSYFLSSLVRAALVGAVAMVGGVACVSSEGDSGDNPASGGMTGAAGSSGSAGTPSNPPESGSKAVQIAIENNTWGGGLGVWMPCVDATPFGGVSFWSKGSVPGGSVELQLTTSPIVEQPVGECEVIPCQPASAAFEVGDTWQKHDLAWSDFEPGTSGTESVPANGDKLFGLNFNIPNNNMPNTLVFAIDDLAFLPGSGVSASEGPNPGTGDGSVTPQCTTVAEIGTGTSINNFDGMAMPGDSFGFGTPQIYAGFYSYKDNESTPPSTATLSLEPGH